MSLPLPRRPDDSTLTVRERLLHAATRIAELGEAPQGAPSARSFLRPEQANVFHQAAAYLTDVATRPEQTPSKPAFARILQPPRTGKTVVAAHIIGASGLSATFVVPSRTLVRQTCAELRRHLPDTSVGRFDGEESSVVGDGVNVTTYAMLHARTKSGPLPEAIRTAPLIFVDEAHHAMTEARTRIFYDAFDPGSIRSVREVDGRGNSNSRPVRAYQNTPITGVNLRQRILVLTTLAKPAVHRGDWEGIRRVLASCLDFRFDAPPAFARFRWMMFSHPAFSGQGAFLLRWLQFPSSRAGYAAFLARACLGIDVSSFLDKPVGDGEPGETWCQDDVARVVAATLDVHRTSRADRLGLADAWRAFAGVSNDSVALPCEAIERAEAALWALLSLVTALKTRHRCALAFHCGLGSLAELGFAEQGDLAWVTQETIRQRVQVGCTQLRSPATDFADYEQTMGFGPPEPTVGPADSPYALGPLSLEFVSAVVGAFVWMEVNDGYLAEGYGEEQRHFGECRETAPWTALEWVQAVKRSLQQVDRVLAEAPPECDLTAVLAAAVVRSCILKRSWGLNNKELHGLLRTVPHALHFEAGERPEPAAYAGPFGQWYLDTHMRFALLGPTLREAAAVLLPSLRVPLDSAPPSLDQAVADGRPPSSELPIGQAMPTGNTARPARRSNPCPEEAGPCRLRNS